MTKSHLKHPAIPSKTTIATLSAIVIAIRVPKTCLKNADVGKKTVSTIIIMVSIGFLPSSSTPVGATDCCDHRHARRRARPFPAQDARRASAAACVAWPLSLSSLNLRWIWRWEKDGLRQLFTSRTFYSVSQGGNSCGDIRLPKEMKGLLQKKNYKILVLLCTLRYPEITNVYRPSTGDSQIKVHNVSTFYPELEHWCGGMFFFACVFFKLLPLGKGDSPFVWGTCIAPPVTIPSSHHPIILAPL